MKKSSAAAAAAAADLPSTPADLLFDCQPFDIAFHPRADVLAVGLVSGAVHLVALGGGGAARRAHVYAAHTGAVRALAFNEAGDGA